MSTPYRTPRVPHAPHPTPLSASHNLSGFKHPRAPIHNPYDKFPKADFDEWINGLTGALKGALGQGEPVAQLHSKQQSSRWMQAGDGSLKFPPVDMSEDDEEFGNETFAEIRARRLGKGKARDPREGPGLQNGQRHEPIEILSSDDEIDEVAQSIRIDEDDEDEDEEHMEDQEEILREVREFVAQEEEDEDVEGADYDEEEAVDEHPSEPEDDHASDELQSEHDEIIQRPSGSRSEVHHTVSKSQISDSEAEEWDEDDEGDEEEDEEYSDEEEHGYAAKPHPRNNDGSPEIIEITSDDDEPEQDASPPQPVLLPIASTTRLPGRVPGHADETSRGKSSSHLHTDEEDLEDDWDEENEEEHDELEGEDHEYSVPEVLPRREASRSPSISRIPPNNVEPLENFHHSEDQEAEEEELDDMQPQDDDTSFPPPSSRQARKADDHVEIRDPWEGAEYYAEDLYKGGDQISGSDPHHLNGMDDDVVMDSEDTDQQPIERNTAFPPLESTPPSIEIPDQWRPVETFAEDFFSGGDVRPEAIPLDPSLLVGSADSVDVQQYKQPTSEGATEPENIALEESDKGKGTEQNTTDVDVSMEDDDIPVIHFDMGDGTYDTEVNHNFTVIPPTPMMSSALSDFDPESDGDLLSTFDLTVPHNAMLFSSHNFDNSFLSTAPGELSITSAGDQQMNPQKDNGDSVSVPVDMDKDVEEALHADESTPDQTVVEIVTGTVEEVVADEAHLPVSESHSEDIQIDAPSPHQIHLEDEVPYEEGLQSTGPQQEVLTDTVMMEAEMSMDAPVSPEDDVQPPINAPGNEAGPPEYEQLPTPPSERNYLPTSPVQKHAVELEEIPDPEADISQPKILKDGDSAHKLVETEEDSVSPDGMDNNDAEGEEEWDDEVEILSVISSSELAIRLDESAYEVEEPITEGRLTEEPPSGHQVGEPAVESIDYEESHASDSPGVFGSFKCDPPSEFPQSNIPDLFTPAASSPRNASFPANRPENDAGGIIPPVHGHGDIGIQAHQPSTMIMTMPLTRKSTDPILVADPFPASLSTPGITLLPDNDGDDEAGADHSLNSESSIDKEADLDDLDFQYPLAPIVPALPEIAGDSTSHSLVLDNETKDTTTLSADPEENLVISDGPAALTNSDDGQDHVPSLGANSPHNTSKRKRVASEAEQEDTAPKQKGKKIKGKHHKITSPPEKVEGDVVVVKPHARAKASVHRSWTPVKHSSSGTSISQKPDSIASSVDSAQSEMSWKLQASPTVDKPRVSRQSPVPIDLLQHRHGQKKSTNYAPSYNSKPNPPPTVPLIEKPPVESVPRSSTPVPSTLINLPPTPTPAPVVFISNTTAIARSPSPVQPSPVASPVIPFIPAPVSEPPLPYSFGKPITHSPDPPTATPAKHAPVVSTSHTPITRSHCRYHKISLPKSDDEGSPRVFFLVPGCSLAHPELLREEEIEDHGEASQEDGARMIRDINSLNFDSSMIGILRQLVGLDILREQEVFYLPSPGDEVTKKQPIFRTSSEKASVIRAGEGSTYSGSPGHSASPKPPVSAANSISTTRSFYHKKGSITPSIQSEGEDDVEEGPSKRIRPLSPNVGQEAVSMGPPKLVVKKARRSGRIDTAYEPDEDDEDEDEKRKRKRKPKKRGVKRTRTADTLDDEKPSRKSKKLKTHATMPISFTTESSVTQTESQDQTPPL